MAEQTIFDWPDPSTPRTVEVLLPSQRLATLRAVDLFFIAKLGRIPDSLTPLIAEGIETGSISLDTEKPDGMANMIELIELVCKSCFVVPRIVDKPKKKGEISIDDLTPDDKLFVMQFFNRPIAMLESFRERQKASLEPVHAQQGDGDSA